MNERGSLPERPLRLLVAAGLTDRRCFVCDDGALAEVEARVHAGDGGGSSRGRRLVSI
jgi:hypothetical protein